MRIILSGGGTGGHIYPAVAVAEALKRRLGEGDGGVELLFVGALGKMEMEKIPALGYEIKGLPVAGLQRRLDPKNLLLPFKVAKSLRLARKIIHDFGADVVVGFGGYASAPVLRAAQGMGIPTIIQEQNSYAGLTNKMLARKAKHICVAYDGMERFFPAGSIVKTGNPLRGNFSAGISRAEALEYFGFTTDKPVLLVVGGSLGSRTFNEMMKRHIENLVKEGNVQVIWQTGKYYEAEMDAFMASKFGSTTSPSQSEGTPPSQGGEFPLLPEGGVAVGTADGVVGLSNIWRGAFVDRMDLAYAAADLVISRSGANTVSELSLLGKAVLFVPSPNVAEDHQTKNAMALVEKGAAAICHDADAVERAIPMALELLREPEKLSAMSKNIARLGISDSAELITEIIINSLINKD